MRNGTSDVDLSVPTFPHFGGKEGGGDVRALEEPGLLPIATLVVWCGCLAVGVLGIVLSGHRPKGPAPPLLVETELLNVEGASPQAAEAPSAQAPQPNSTMTPPPDVPAVAAPAFTQPLEQPKLKPMPRQVVAASKPTMLAAATKPAAAPAANAGVPGVTHLTYGEGEGDQPAPEEPEEAVLDAEEGTVVVRMTVDEDGRVIEAHAVSPCRWPLLNSAAVHAIRSTWRFRRGPVRIYEVAIEFVINRQ